MKKLTTAYLIATSVLTASCSSTPTSKDISEQEMELQKVKMELAAERNKAKVFLIESKIEQTPEWIISPPRMDETGFYGAAQAESESATVANQKALLLAKYQVASIIKSELSGESTINGDGDENYRFVINNFVNKMDMSGVEIIKRKVIASPEGKYLVFVLVKMPVKEFNQALAYLKKDKKTTETLQASYERLMDRVKAENPDKKE